MIQRAATSSSVCMTTAGYRMHPQKSQRLARQNAASHHERIVLRNTNRTHAVYGQELDGISRFCDNVRLLADSTSPPRDKLR